MERAKVDPSGGKDQVSGQTNNNTSSKKSFLGLNVTIIAMVLSGCANRHTYGEKK